MVSLIYAQCFPPGHLMYFLGLEFEQYHSTVLTLEWNRLLRFDFLNL